MKEHAILKKNQNDKQEIISCYYQNLNNEEKTLASKQRETNHLQWRRLSWPQISPQECSMPESERVMPEEFSKNDKGTKHDCIWPIYHGSIKIKSRHSKLNTGTQHPWAPRNGSVKIQPAMAWVKRQQKS